jgi:hypothetical protein
LGPRAESPYLELGQRVIARSGGGGNLS